MMRFFTFLLCGLLFAVDALCQMADSSHSLPGVLVKDSVHMVTPTESIGIHTENPRSGPVTNLLNDINKMTGVRMEERSPGSYRLSIRGSLLRSPFGIRNVKMYLEDLPITDASGNTYLNLFDPEMFRNYDVYLGPPDDQFGSNTGGAIDFKTLPPADRTGRPPFTASILIGQYGLYKAFVSENIRRKKWLLNLTASYQKQDGYRANSSFQRAYFQAIDRWQYHKNASLKIIAIFSDLQYHTPGGLTLAQYTADPAAARPATKTLPGAADQQAAIYNKTFIGGLVHEAKLAPNLTHVIAVSGMFTDFKNPFITNYETRSENTYSIRSWLVDTLIKQEHLKLNISGGWEGQSLYSTINNYDNNRGVLGKEQTGDQLITNQQFFWAGSALSLRHFELNLSANYGTYGYTYSSQFPQAIGKQHIAFDPQIMPRLQISYLPTGNINPYLIVNRGYSSPTAEEVRASDQVINTNLQAERGWNYEVGVQFLSKSSMLYAKVDGHYFQMENTIVRRLNANEEDYYINTGKTNQLGLEIQTRAYVFRGRSGFFNQLELNAGYTGSSYHFVNYVVDSSNYSGNKITGVPQHVFVLTAETRMRNRLYIYGQYTFTSSIPLDDANQNFSKPYHLLQVRIGYYLINRLPRRLEVYIGGDNLLNQKYSLGNDLNAVGGRYYNAAAPLNFYAGLKLSWK